MKLSSLKNIVDQLRIFIIDRAFSSPFNFWWVLLCFKCVAQLFTRKFLAFNNFLGIIFFILCSVSIIRKGTMNVEFIACRILFQAHIDGFRRFNRTLSETFTLSDFLIVAAYL
ncbi:hypothetical protein BY996DRAFT_6782732 [Phakopsora pachyrhizi]|nr:hypothetical protein BY996DRAFT_6782732 [Phakopsora pachyrhizi]